MVASNPAQTASDWVCRRSGEHSRPDDVRTPAEIDYGRAIHSSSFRRLQGKTQIIDISNGEGFRTRLTHSLEVAQIGAGIFQRLNRLNPETEIAELTADQAQIQVAGLLHDIGHPPFGHSGESALHYMMRDNGGFEGNGQTLRIISILENFVNGYGADLTRRTMLSVLKYPVSMSSAFNPADLPEPRRSAAGPLQLDRNRHAPPKAFFATEQSVVDWLLLPLGSEGARRVQAEGIKSFDCQIMDIADDISYGVGDLEDAISLGLVDRESLTKAIPYSIAKPFIDWTLSRGGSTTYVGALDSLFGSSRDRKSIIGSLTGYMIGQVEAHKTELFDDPLYQYSVSMTPPAAELLKALKRFVMDEVILAAHVQHTRFRGQKMILGCMDLLLTEPDNYLPAKQLKAFNATGRDPRLICDWIAGHTDAHLQRLYERLFQPRAGTVHDKL